MGRKHFVIFLSAVGMTALMVLVLGLAYAKPFASNTSYIPVVNRGEEKEFRGVWVTRFDWTTGTQSASPAKIDEIVQNVADAGFNVVFFQVRGTADAYYEPGPEPWAARVSGGILGQAPVPFWDPLAYFIQKAHAKGIQLHAYINVYPVWDSCQTPPPQTSPEHFYYLLEQEHGTTNGKLNGLQWTTGGSVYCGSYLRATPASTFTDDHLLEVVDYLASHYDIDGIHLDHIRYGGSNTSCDPVSAAASGVPCFSTPPSGYGSYQDWQRAQVNGTVYKIYNHLVDNYPDLWLSAAVWPIYFERPEWGWGGFALEGYNDLYQDSKAWVQGGYIDINDPMIYPGSTNCPDDSFWTLDKWKTLVADFMADSGDRLIIPGIGSDYCTFDEIADRINAGRQLGTAGQAIFSYGALLTHQYFDDLAAGPYAVPAEVPEMTWR
ncbi:MAG: family 10 glycosylhydrolase [Candidatus Promineifilaceae bacterium]